MSSQNVEGRFRSAAQLPLLAATLLAFQRRGDARRGRQAIAVFAAAAAEGLSRP